MTMQNYKIKDEFLQFLHFKLSFSFRLQVSTPTLST